MATQLSNRAASVSRRTFVRDAALVALAASAAVKGLETCAPTVAQAATAPATTQGGYRYEAEEADGTWHHSACNRNCYDECMILSKVVDGQLVQVTGDPDSPYTAGGLCVKTQNYVDYVYSPDRILYPLRRTGTKGPGCTFERISWDEAIQTITDTWKQIIEESGPEAIMRYRFQGTQGKINVAGTDPLFYKMGATYCKPSMCEASYEATVESFMGWTTCMKPDAIATKNLYISWAHNECACSVHSVKYIKEMAKKGGKVVVVNPAHIPLCDWDALWIKLRPGTDAALALGVSNYLIEHAMIDERFIEEHCVGFDEFAAEAAPWTVELTAETCGIPAEQVVELAELLYEHRDAFCLKVGLQMSRRINGGISNMAVNLLPFVLGRPQGLFEMTSAGGWSSGLTGGRDLLEGTPRECASPDLGAVLTGQLNVEDGDFTQNPIRSLYAYSSNPMVTAPNQSLIEKGLAREDLFTVVHDLFVTPTAEYADIILPAATFFEFEEFNGGYGHTFDIFNEQVIEPLGEAKANWEVCNLLGQAMGYEEDYFHRTQEEFRTDILERKGRTYDEVREKGWFEMEPQSWDAQLAEGFGTASGKVQFASDEWEELSGLRTVSYIPDPEMVDGNPALAEKYPLALVNPSAKEFLNGIFGNMPDNKNLFGENYLYLNEAEAAERGIVTGDTVRVFNDRGEVTRIAAVVDGVTAPATVLAYKSTWRGQDAFEDINFVTTDERTDFGKGCAFQSCLVEVEKA